MSEPTPVWNTLRKWNDDTKTLTEALRQSSKLTPSTEPPENQVKCKLCGDLGWVLPGGIPIGHQDFGKPIECPCGQVRAKRLALFDEAFGFSDELKAETIEGVRDIPGNEEGKIALYEYLAMAPRWLFLWGTYGDGKTKMIAAIVNKLRSDGIEAVFAVVPELLDYLRGHYDKESKTTFEAEFTRIRNIPVLALDEINGERPTDWAVEKVCELINWRYRMNLPTIATSNKHPDQLHDKRLSSRFMDVKIGIVANCGPHDVRRYPR